MLVSHFVIDIRDINKLSSLIYSTLKFNKTTIQCLNTNNYWTFREYDLNYTSTNFWCQGNLLSDQLTSIDKTSLDRSRRWRFFKQSAKCISKSSIELSQNIWNNKRKTSPKIGWFYSNTPKWWFTRNNLHCRNYSNKKDWFNRKGNGWEVDDYKHNFNGNLLLKHQKESWQIFDFY